MKVFFDTSVLIAAVVQSHPFHERARSWLEKARGGEFEWVVASHSLAEMYAVLTTLPVKPRISPGSAWRLIRENVESAAEVASLTAKDYVSLLKEASERGLTGGVIYDALLARVAERAGVERLLTFDPEDFRRAWPEGARRVETP